MLISFKKLSLLILSVFAFAVSVNADTLYLNGVSGNVDLTGQVYISPYLGGLNNPSGMDNIYCVDPEDDSYLNTSWEVNVTLLDNNNDLSETYLGMDPTVTDTEALKRYEEAAWLLFYTGFGEETMSSADEAAIQAAVWYIIDPDSALGENNNWVTAAETHYTEGDYSTVYILSEIITADVDQENPNQEFMIKASVPEPTTLLLLGSGLLGLLGLRKKLKK